MKIIHAKILGFCAGVRRAVLAAEKALSENKSGDVYTLGPLIHNPVALEKLAERNLKILTEDEIPNLKENDTVIIRAHGVSPDVYDKIQKKGVKFINATCPLVTKSQERAAQFARSGYIIFFAGDKNHGEVIGIEGCAKKAAEESGKNLHFLLIKDVDEMKNQIKKMSSQQILSKDSKIVLLSQTTFSIKMFDSLKSELKSVFPSAEALSSICPATHERQDALRELCEKSDGIIVIGGKTSANTNRLFATAKKLCKKAILIERPEEITAEIIKEFSSLETVGITAGASTPDDTILAVEERFLRNSEIGGRTLHSN